MLSPVAILMVALLAVAVLTTAGLHSLSSPLATEAPRPFDPLSEQEAQTAIALAYADPAVAALLQGRHELIGAALRTEKVYPITDMPRLADVWFYDYTTDTVVWPVVDLGLGLVRALEVPPLGYQPPLTGNENDRAIRLAIEHPGVLDRLPEGEVLPVARLWGGAHTLCPVHRCVTVSFFVDDVWQTDFFVAVDLSLETVLGIIEPEDATPEEEEDGA